MLLIILYFSNTICLHAQYKRFRNYNIDHGLSQSMVTAITQDHNGYMWFGTKDGLNRYDGYSFKTYRSIAGDSTSISDNHITSIHIDDQNRLWVGTMYGGINLYNEAKDRFIRIKPGKLNFNPKFVSSITGNSQYGIWVSFWDGHVIGFDAKNIHAQTQPEATLILSDKTLGNPIPQSVFLDDDGTVWISTNKGLMRYDIINRLWKPLPQLPTHTVICTTGKSGEWQYNTGPHPSSVQIRMVYKDTDGAYWLVSLIGLFKYDKTKDHYTYIQIGPTKPGTYTMSLVKKDNGEKEIWISIYQGLVVLDPKTYTLTYHQTGNADGLLNSRYVCMYNNNGTVWIGSNGKGILTSSKENTLFHNNHPPYADEIRKNVRSVLALYKTEYSQNGHSYLFISNFGNLIQHDERTNSYTIVHSDYGSQAIAEDKKGNVWISSHRGLMRYEPVSRQKEFFENCRDSSIMSIYPEGNDIWYSTATTLVCFDNQKGTAKRFKFFPDIKDNFFSFQDKFYSTISPDPDGTLWVGSIDGLFHFDKGQEKFIEIFKNTQSNANGLSSTEIKSIYCDRQNTDIVWIGTTLGLNKLDKKTHTFTRYLTGDGLPNNTIYSVQPDKKGNLWLSTNKGLSVFNPNNETFINFDVNNGLQSNEFNTGSYCRTSDGELFFGGVNGFNRFFPENIRIPQRDVPTVISNIQLLGVETGTSPGISPATESLSLTYDQNNISITLSSLDYASPEKAQYAYRILNRDSSWIALGNNRTVTLTNLSPGRYVFQGRGSDSFGRWNQDIAEFTITILPPWWTTTWAKIGYFILALGAVYYLWMRYKKKLLLQQAIENERRQAAAVLELDKVKSEFLANITHELRTPLTLIKGHVENLKSENEVPSLAVKYDEIENNSNRLLQLISRLLDLSKLESGEYNLHFRQANIIHDVKGAVFAFHSYAEQKNIRFELDITETAQQKLAENPFIYDREVLITIINNLLSNACKFTPNGGSIKTGLGYEEGERPSVVIKVTDTGPGIKQEDLHKIFDRFYQSDSSATRSHEGSGIGLSLVKELAELHGGKVSVNSHVGKGSTFTVHLAKGSSNISDGEPIENQQVIQTAENTTQQSTKEELPIVLVVEDHNELRQFICECLGTAYRFVEARNGKDGLAMAQQLVPDLIISDVMMPEMDGFTLCSHIKNHELTSHIPVILLTARVTQKDKITGLETGADDYLIKPFSAHELRIRVANLIRSRRLLFQKFAATPPNQQQEAEISPKDKEFLQKLFDITSNNLTNPQFGVDMLADCLHISPSQLNRKLKAITGATAVLFIRNVRMQKALELLRTNPDHIASIAFEVGFEDPSYFSKVFKNHFGFLPSEKEKINKVEKSNYLQINIL